MKKLAIATLIGLGLTVVGGSASLAQSSFSVTIPVGTVVRGPEDSVRTLTVQSTPADAVGETCAVTAESFNQDSAHPNSDLLISSGGSYVEIFDVERDPFETKFATGDLTLGPDITVGVRFGSDEVFSGGITINFDCSGNPTVTPAEPQYTPGDCDGPGEVIAPNTDEYTWTITGPADNPTYTAVANPGYTLTGQTEYGPYDISQQTEDCDTPVTPAEPQYTPGDCDGPGSLIATDTEAYTWTITGPDDALIATAVANPGFGLTGDTVFGPYDISQQTDGCAPPPCPYNPDIPEDDSNCVPPEEPSIDVTAFAPVCQGDIPYIDYRIEVSGTDANTADLTFIDLDGNVVQELTDQPLSGRVIYPGASEDPPDWPGWELNDEGLWVIDLTDARWRDGLTIRVEVNPTAEAQVSYPPETEACNSPENPTTTTTAGRTSSGGSGSLPVTGNNTYLAALIAIVLLSGGGALVLATRRRSD